MSFIRIAHPTPGTLPFSTTFPATENPISQGVIWTRGRQEGIDWNSPQTALNVDGNGTGAWAGAATSVSFDDSIAHLNATFTANQYAEATMFMTPGYNPDGHEIELLVRFNISAHSATGYEVYWSWNQGINIVRWNGAIGDFTPLNSSSGNVPSTGRVMRVEVIGNVINVYVDGVLNVSATDSTWASGHAGIGFGPYPGVNTLTSYGWSSFRAGNL